MDRKATKPDPVEVVAEALRAFGGLTAAAIAEKTGMAYSTVTPKLRTLEDAGRAERVKTAGRTFWRLTARPAQASADEAAAHLSNDDPTGLPAGEVDPTATTEPRALAEAPTAANASDDEPPAGADTTPTTEAAQPADDPDSADAAPADQPAPNPAANAQPESEPTAAAPNDQADGDSAPAEQPASETAPAASPAGGTTRRPAGALDRTALRIMQTNPQTRYKVTELGRLIDQADAADGHNYPKASPGAVVLACDRLVDRGDATKVVEKPATYQFAAAQPANP